MSLVDIFRFVGDIISDFVNSNLSGIIFLAFVGIPLALQAFLILTRLSVRSFYDDKEKTEDNDR